MTTLEDDFTYVLRKALRGTGISPAEAAGRAGLPTSAVEAVLEGEFSEQTARALAPVLHLQAEALADHPDYLPAALALAGVEPLALPFRGDQVNAWLVRGGGAVLLFDTGLEPHSCTSALSDRGVSHIDATFLTHAHPDHIGGLAEVRRLSAAVYGPGISGAQPLSAGAEFGYGALRVTSVDLSGHAIPALGYLLQGLERPVLVTGDALFAGSVGGCPDPETYQLALSRLREVLTPLPGETVLLPGHGPATTLAEELAANPFLSSFP